MGSAEAASAAGVSVGIANVAVAPVLPALRFLEEEPLVLAVPVLGTVPSPPVAVPGSAAAPAVLVTPTAAVSLALLSSMARSVMTVGASGLYSMASGVWNSGAKVTWTPIPRMLARASHGTRPIPIPTLYAEYMPCDRPM